jgi:hypothetical protein
MALPATLVLALWSAAPRPHAPAPQGERPLALAELPGDGGFRGPRPAFDHGDPHSDHKEGTGTGEEAPVDDLVGKELPLVPSRPTAVTMSGRVFQEPSGHWVADLVVVNRGAPIADGRLVVMATIRRPDGEVARVNGRERTFKARKMTTKHVELLGGKDAIGKVIDVTVVTADARSGDVVLYGASLTSAVAH